MEKRPKLSRWEVAAIIASLLVIAASFAAYVFDFPILASLFDYEYETARTRAGVLARLSGELRRQTWQEIEFKTIPSGVEVFDGDTLVTGPVSTALVSLDDGGSLELGPGTMIRLTFEPPLKFYSVSHVARVRVFKGQVKGRAHSRKIAIVVGKGNEKKEITVSRNDEKVISYVDEKTLALPVSTPVAVASPLAVPLTVKEVRYISPPDGAMLSLPINAQSSSYELRVPFSWRVEPAPETVTVVLRRDSSEVVRATVSGESAAKVVNRSYTVSKPGRYEWEILDSNGKAFAAAKKRRSWFRVEEKFEGITLSDALIGGSARKTNRAREGLADDLKITLKWDHVEAAGTYLVRFGRSSDMRKPFFERKTDKLAIVVDPGTVSNARFFYQVSAALPNGFVAVSKVKEFSFSFMPPVVTAPLDHAAVAASPKDGRVLFTWEVTNFTEGYDVEIARDREFRDVQVRERIKHNFVRAKVPASGKYWWRVRSRTKAAPSSWSEPKQFALH